MKAPAGIESFTVAAVEGMGGAVEKRADGTTTTEQIIPVRFVPLIRDRPKPD